jgi:hypothetical protein
MAFFYKVTRLWRDLSLAQFFYRVKKMKRMKSSSIYLIVITLLIVCGVAFVKCGGADTKPVRTTADSSSVVGPAPDNNSANNPSLADTNYEKDRTRPITDTMKKK